jgi:hypothetical protein
MAVSADQPYSSSAALFQYPISAPAGRAAAHYLPPQQGVFHVPALWQPNLTGNQEYPAAVVSGYQVNAETLLNLPLQEDDIVRKKIT